MWLKSILRRWFGSDDRWDLALEEEVEQEIETHLELRVTALVESGMTPEAARREAQRRFGDVPAAVNALRQGARRRQAARRSDARIESLRADLSLAWRQICRAPRFTLVTIATLALGIGATTATFTLVRSVVLHPLPFPDSDRLVALQELDSVHNLVPVVSSGDWLDWKQGAGSLESTAIHFNRRMSVELESEPIRVDGELVSADFFRVLQSQFMQGRSFTTDEVDHRAAVMVVSASFLQRLPQGVSALNRALTVDGRKYQIVGVVKPGQEFPGETQVFLPADFQPETGALRNNVNWYAIARLAPGVTREQAAAELNGIARGIRSNNPEALYSYGVPVESLKQFVVGDTAQYLNILMGAVLLVLLVACANLAAAHLARGLVRSRETAVRAALGADRRRLVQQVLVEHALLGVVGGAFGVLLAWGGVRVVLQLWGERIPRAGEVSLDLLVVAFALFVSLGAGLLTGLAPALQAAKPSLVGLIAAGGRGQVRGGRGLPGAFLIVAEVALALVLLTGAGLLIRSLQSLLSRDIGFDPNVLTVSATLADPQYRSDPTRRIAYWDQVSRELATLPGAKTSGVATWVPLAMAASTFIEVENGSQAPSGFGYRTVSQNYLAALGVPLVSGRNFGPEDGPGSARVVLINQLAAELVWPGVDPIGKRFKAVSMERGPKGEAAPWVTVIGVVGNLRQWGPYLEPRPEMYVLFRQVPQFTTGMTAIASASTPVEQLIPAARARLRAIDPSVALEIGTLDASLTRLLAPQRLPVSLLTGFGIFALLLTALGLYGLLSYSVSQRRRELALRAALGAHRGQLIRSAALGGVKLVLIGSAIGLVAALGLSRLLESMLFDVTPFDPITYLLVVLLLLVVALLSILIPTLSGTRLDPAVALNVE